MDFETKIAAAGDALVKLAADRGLTLSDFTEQESMDLLEMLMNEPKVATETTPPAGTAPQAAAPAAQPEKVAGEQPQVDYGMAMAEVVKVAAANGYDLTKASPAELNDAVVKMAELMSDPTYATKQAAFQEKLAEADAIGRVMAHSYVDELSKIAEANKVAAGKTDEEKREEEKNEKKAALVRELRAKTAGGMPPQFAEHMHGKGKDEKNEKKDEDEKKEKEEAEKKANFAKVAELRAAQILIENGVNPATSAKFASAEEQVDAAAINLLALKGYKVG